MKDHQSVEPSQEATLPERLREAADFPWFDQGDSGLLSEAADALDAKDKRIRELEMPRFTCGKADCRCCNE